MPAPDRAFRALADPTRRAIFERLVRRRPEGREVHYRAEPRALRPLVDWLRHYDAFWRERFDALESVLERMDQ